MSPHDILRSDSALRGIEHNFEGGRNCVIKVGAEEGEYGKA